MRPGVPSTKNRLIAYFCYPAGFLVLFLLVAGNSYAEMNKWQYKLVTEKNMIVKCTQTIKDKCITWNWISKDDQCVTKLVTGENPKEVRVEEHPEVHAPVEESHE